MMSIIRFMLALFLLGISLVATANPRLASIDWAATETLAALNLPPVIAADKIAFAKWTGLNTLPVQTQDAGLRMQPNLEALRQAKPEMIIASSWYAHLSPRLSPIAPIHELNFFTPKGIEWANTLNATRQLAKLAGNAAAGETLIRHAQQQFNQQKQHLTSIAQQRPIAIVQFSDARHLRIFGHTSLYHVVMQQLGLRNAWQGESNAWGFANISITELVKLPPNTLLIIVKPHPPQTEQALSHSILWQRLPFSKDQNRRILPAAWAFGGLPSMMRFANHLSAALQTGASVSW